MVGGAGEAGGDSEGVYGEEGGEMVVGVGVRRGGRGHGCGVSGV